MSFFSDLTVKIFEAKKLLPVCPVGFKRIVLVSEKYFDPEEVKKFNNGEIEILRPKQPWWRRKIKQK